jgi:hypothetical protein
MITLTRRTDGQIQFDPAAKHRRSGQRFEQLRIG